MRKLGILSTVLHALSFGLLGNTKVTLETAPTRKPKMLPAKLPIITRNYKASRRPTIIKPEYRLTESPFKEVYVPQTYDPTLNPHKSWRRYRTNSGRICYKPCYKEAA